MKNNNRNQVTHTEGQRIEITIHAPRIGKFPIGRTAEGKICKIVMHTPKAFYEYGSTWNATIEQVNEKSLTVMPYECVRTAEQDRNKVKEMLTGIQKVLRRERDREPRKGYQYMSANDKRRQA